MRIASPDHFAVELAVLAHLYALLDTATAVHEFLCDHVLPWAPAYCEQVAAATILGFFRTTARLVAALLAAEAPSGKANSRPGEPGSYAACYPSVSEVVSPDTNIYCIDHSMVQDVTYCF